MRGLLYGGNAAIDGNDEACAGSLDFLEGCGVQPVALAYPVGYVTANMRAETLERQVQERGAAYAVYIIVAVHDDLFTARQRGPNPADGLFHPAEDTGIGQGSEFTGEKEPSI